MAEINVSVVDQNTIPALLKFLADPKHGLSEQALLACGVDLNASVIAQRGAEILAAGVLGSRNARGWLSVFSADASENVASSLISPLWDAAVARKFETVVAEIPAGNAASAAVLQGAGFSDARELLTWTRSADQGGLPDPPYKLQTADPIQIFEQTRIWQENLPCWQRENLTLGDARAITIVNDGNLLAYALFRFAEETIVLLDVGVSPHESPRRIGRALLQGFHLRFFGKEVVFAKEPVESAWNSVFAALGYYVTARHLEFRAQHASLPKTTP